jgi:formylglycine-generating enzyme required for sulfatase activity
VTSAKHGRVLLFAVAPAILLACGLGALLAKNPLRIESDEPPAPSATWTGAFDPGRIWYDQEGPFQGTWVRRGDTNVFDASWTDGKGHGPGHEVSTEITLESVKDRTVVLYRKDVGGRYTGTLSADGLRVVDGTVSWSSDPSIRWTATIFSPATGSRIRADLADGSWIIGKPAVDQLDMHTEHGDVRLKWSDVRTVLWTAGEPDAQFNLANGDHLSGRLAVEKLEVKALFGPVMIPLVHVRRLTAMGDGGDDLSLDLGGGVAMKLVFIRPGKFMMGSADGEPLPDEKAQPGKRNNEAPVHEVTLSSPFFMGATHVTQAQYEAVMGANPSVHKDPPCPVDSVSWDDSVAFTKKLAEKVGRPVRLPTEAEWEYACRAGTVTRYSFGDDADKLGDYGWYARNSGGVTHPVAQKKPNAWGLYDMHGNVWQWCSDFRGPYAKDPQTDPIGPASGPGPGEMGDNGNLFPQDSDHVYRGGSCHDQPEHCRAAMRKSQPANFRNQTLGLRVVVPSDVALPKKN